MSGSSGGYMPEIKSVDNTDCSKLVFSTSLSSPIAIVIANLAIGDELDVQLISPASLQVFNSDGELAGTILNTNRDRIINCIQNGFEYIATVINSSC